MSPRVLITGASGFAGSHLAEACTNAGDHVFGVSRSLDTVMPGGETEILSADLCDARAAREAVEMAAPDVVYHLAALASVARSWDDPESALTDNTRLTLNLFESVRELAPEAVVVFASSGELYGPPETLPVDETASLRPQNPYAIAKAATDLLAGLYADAYGLNVVRARSFNHAGPRQSPVFAIASFARQIAVAQNRDEKIVRVVSGSPDPRRDFTDVRDVARAYRLLAERGKAGLFNVCSGRSVAIGELIERLGSVTGMEINHEIDSDLIRPHEVPEVRGSHDRLTEATGWEPEIPLDQTLADAVDWWREELRETETENAGDPA